MKKLVRFQPPPLNYSSKNETYFDFLVRVQVPPLINNNWGNSRIGTGNKFRICINKDSLIGFSIILILRVISVVDKQFHRLRVGSSILPPATNKSSKEDSYFAQLAQLVEHLNSNQNDVGSIPTLCFKTTIAGNLSCSLPLIFHYIYSQKRELQKCSSLFISL